MAEKRTDGRTDGRSRKRAASIPGDGARGRKAGLVRALKLMRHLDGRRRVAPLSALAEEFSVHQRTIRRDLEAIEEAGVTLPPWRSADDAHLLGIEMHGGQLIPVRRR